MSCGGNAATNRNARAISDAVAAAPGGLTVGEARETFHRLSAAVRTTAAAAFRDEHGRSPDWHEARDMTQTAHAAARARMTAEARLAAYALNAADSNTRTICDDAARWAATDPEVAAVLTPNQAATEVRLARRRRVLDALARTDGQPDDTRLQAARDVLHDPGHVAPGHGDAQQWLAVAARDRAAGIDSRRSGAGQGPAVGQGQADRETWARVAARTDRAAAIAGVHGEPEPVAPENWDRVVDHSAPYGPALQARFDSLPPQAQQLLRLRHGADPSAPGRRHTLDEVADRLGISRERARMSESRAETRMRRPAD